MVILNCWLSILDSDNLIRRSINSPSQNKNKVWFKVLYMKVKLCFVYLLLHPKYFLRLIKGQQLWKWLIIKIKLLCTMTACTSIMTFFHFTTYWVNFILMIWRIVWEWLTRLLDYSKASLNFTDLFPTTVWNFFFFVPKPTMNELEGVPKISRLTNGCFTTISSHFLAIYNTSLTKLNIARSFWGAEQV